MSLHIVALHGFWGAPEDWSGVRNALQSRGWSWHIPDLFRDTEIGPQVAIEDWSAAFHAWLEREVPAPRWLLGYSLGGRLALQALARSPRDFTGAVILSADPRQLKDTAETRRQSDAEWARRFLTEDEASLQTAWQAQAVLATSKLKTFRPLDEELRASLARALETWSVARQPEATPAARAGLPPTLWLAGEKDEKFARLYRQLSQTGVPGRFRVLPGVGHRILNDGPGEVAAQISEFMKEISDERELGTVVGESEL